MTKYHNYSEEHKKATIVAFFKSNMSKTDFINENHLVNSTFYSWLNKYKVEVKKELNLSEADVANVLNSTSHQVYTSEQKYKIVQETLAMNEVELGQYCLDHNLRESQIRRWAENCKTANEGTDYRSKYEIEHNQYKEAQKVIHDLNAAMKEKEKELERMKDALAEYAVRETTLKKFQAIFAQEKEAQ